MTSDAMLDGGFAMKEFFFGMSSRNYTMRIDGKNVGGENFEVTIKTGGSSTKMQVKIPSDAVIYSPYLEMVLKQLKPGDSTRLKIFDPMSMSTSTAIIKAGKRETIPIKDQDLETTGLTIDFNNMLIEAWMDDEGQIVRQKTPFGWTMESCTPDEALAYDDEIFGGVDMLSSSGVQVTGEIGDREAIPARRFKLEGVPFDAEQLTSPRQQVLNQGGPLD